METLLRVYAKCIDGRRDANNKLIEERLNEGLAKPDKAAKGGKRKKKGKGKKHK
ncbi:hypothetical protein [Yinghuangia soli]|uniref:hypothetical protein n=1 Tax=Yinghuangia soli TaxID=2908204 RepID=UPI0025464D4A|nr:hypothetical protein [Yinghuangia soli]